MAPAKKAVSTMPPMTPRLRGSRNREDQEGQHHDQRQVDAALIEQSERLDARGVELEQGEPDRDDGDQPQHGTRLNIR
jgi:hypothetical protein